jgi:hypothetical protein
MHNETNELPPPVNYVFVDYENVRHLDPGVIGNKTVHLVILLGAQKAKFDADAVQELVDHAEHIQIIRQSYSGANALDFCLAYYLGQAVLADPRGRFYVISKDKDYDPLLKHLQSKGINATRHNDYSSLPFAAKGKPAEVKAPPPAKTAPVTPAKPVPKPAPRLSLVEQREEKALMHLRKAGNRPRTRKRLVSFIVEHLGRIPVPAAEDIVRKFESDGRISIGDNDRVAYKLGQDSTH